MVHIFLYPLLVVIIGLAGYIIRNLLIKNEKYEDLLQESTTAIDTQDKYIKEVHTMIQGTHTKLTELDTKGAFKSDDEVGYFFEELKKAQEVLNRYITSENYDQDSSDE